MSLSTTNRGLSFRTCWNLVKSHNLLLEHVMWWSTIELQLGHML